MRILRQDQQIVLAYRDERDVGERAQRAILDLPSDLFVRPRIEVGGGELRLVHRLDARAIPFAEMASSWQTNLSASLPQAISLLRYLVRAAQRRAQIECRFLPFAPELLFFVRDSLQWKAIALPALAPFSLAEWAGTEEIWPTSPPEAILGDLRRPDTFAIGALLHLALLGDLLPERSPSHRRMKRHLAGHVGRFALLDKAIRRGLPASLEKEGRSLFDFAVALLDPEPTARPTLVEAAQRIGELEGSLSAHRIAVRWEHAGRLPHAREVLEQQSQHAPKEAVAWGALARMRLATGDHEGALDASIRALEIEPKEALGPLLRLLRSPIEEPLLRRGLAALRIFSVSWPEELLRLQIAHLERNVDPSEAMARLSRAMSDRWNEVVRLTMLSRIMIDQREYALISKSTKQARQIIEQLKDRGGRVGRSVFSYLALLDGVANFAAVGKYARVDFLATAYEQLISACEAALAAEASSPVGREASSPVGREASSPVGREASSPVGREAHELVEASAQWLRWIAISIGERATPELEVVRVGIDAYLGTRALVPLMQASAPNVPWYAEEILFPG